MSEKEKLEKLINFVRGLIDTDECYPDMVASELKKRWDISIVYLYNTC